MRTVYILIGLPCSGKSTWRAKFLENNHAIVASSDDVIDRLCEEAGISYNEGFHKFIGQASMSFEAAVKQAMNQGTDLVIDRTNMSEKSRRKFIRLANEKGCRKVAVNFIVPDTVIKQRMQDRFEKTGKSVPESVMGQMARNYDEPSKNEGFDEIITVRSYRHTL